MDTLDGKQGPGGQMQGEVILRIVVDGEQMIRAKAVLDAAQHEVAVQAYRTQEIVKVDGVLTRGKRLGTIDNPRNLQIIQATTPPAPALP